VTVDRSTLTPTFGRFIAAENAQWAGVVKLSGAKLE
jgi:hypothetical protein